MLDKNLLWRILTSPCSEHMCVYIPESGSGGSSNDRSSCYTSHRKLAPGLQVDVRIVSSLCLHTSASFCRMMTKLTAHMPKLNSLPPQVLSPIFINFNSSLTTGAIPHEWKTSIAQFPYAKSPKTLVASHLTRPSSLLATASI